jgi:hypothetical protein
MLNAGHFVFEQTPQLVAPPMDPVNASAQLSLFVAVCPLSVFLKNRIVFLAIFILQFLF